MSVLHLGLNEHPNVLFFALMMENQLYFECDLSCFLRTDMFCASNHHLVVESHEDLGLSICLNPELDFVWNIKMLLLFDILHNWQKIINVRNALTVRFRPCSRTQQWQPLWHTKPQDTSRLQLSLKFVVAHEKITATSCRLLLCGC